MEINVLTNKEKSLVDNQKMVQELIRNIATNIVESRKVEPTKPKIYLWKSIGGLLDDKR